MKKKKLEELRKKCEEQDYKGEIEIDDDYEGSGGLFGFRGKRKKGTKRRISCEALKKK